MADAFATLNGLPRLEGWRDTMLGLPLRKGGLGLRKLDWIAEAAFVGSTLQCAHHVQITVGISLVSTSDPAAEQFRDAVTTLANRFSVSVWEVLEIQAHEACAAPVKKAQKALSDAIMDSITLDWRQRLPNLARAVVDSIATEGNQPGANDWLLAVPKTRAFTIPDTSYRLLLQTRLRLRLVPDGSHCAYFIRNTQRTCGKLLTADVDHCHSCCKAHVLARHHALRDNWAKIYKEVGANAVHTEQPVPELGGESSVVADIRVQEGLSIPLRYLDVVVAHPIDLSSGTWVGAPAGSAARTAERTKFRHYRPALTGHSVLLTPLAYETYGRWGKHAALELRRLARVRAQRADAIASVDPEAVYRGALLRWRRQLSVTLQLGNAHVLASAAGMKPLDGAQAACDASNAAGLILERGF